MNTPEILMVLPILGVSSVVPVAVLFLGITLLDSRGGAEVRVARRRAPEGRLVRSVLRRGVMI